MAENHAQGSSSPRSSVMTAVWCCYYGAGVIACLVVYGLLQERIMAVPYGGEMFTFSAFLVMCNRFIAVIYGAIMLFIIGEPIGWQAPLWKYLVVSLSNVSASFCQYEALKYVAFPVQMLGKSFKMMPVMVWGIVISQKRYTFKDWAVAFFVTFGITAFLLTGPITSGSTDTQGSAFGLGLLACFLLCDGLTSTMQEKLFKEHKTSKYNQILYINGWSFIVSLICLVITAEFIPAFAFCGRHPIMFAQAMELSVAAVAGQYFIYSQVKEFGALVFAATMNLRQVVSIVVSYVQYGHSITGLQVLSLGVVFLALFYKSWQGLTAPGPSAREPRKET